MDVSGIDKAELLAALFNASKQQGMGFIGASGAKLTVEEARTELVLNPSGYFDYLRGRVMKIDMARDDLRTGLYNRDNGEGAAERVIEKLRASLGQAA